MKLNKGVVVKVNEVKQLGMIYSTTCSICQCLQLVLDFNEYNLCINQKAWITPQQISQNIYQMLT